MASETKPRDPERIYLEPWPYSPEGRLWSAENVWPLELWPYSLEDESPRASGVEYIRSDLHAAEVARLTRELEEARALCALCRVEAPEWKPGDPPCARAATPSPDGGDDAP